MTSVYVAGKYVYKTKTSNGGTCSSTDRTGCEFQIYNVSNVNNPTFIGGWDNGSNQLNDVFVSGRYAYIAGAANAGFIILDISNPTNPISVAIVPLSSTNELSVYVSGNYAYIGTDGNTGTCSSSSSIGCELQIYDVSNPYNPNFVGGSDSINAGNGANAVNSVYVAGRYAYVGKAVNAGTCSSSDRTGCEFQIYDVSNPYSPAFVGGADTTDTVNAVYVAGRYAYVGKNNNSGACSSSTSTGCELQIFDV